MKISWLKDANNKNSFRFMKNIGFDVFDVSDLEKLDVEIKKLVDKNYHTIVIPNELAGFSQDLIKKYKYNTDVNIIILPNREKNV